MSNHSKTKTKFSILDDKIIVKIRNHNGNYNNLASYPLTLDSEDLRAKIRSAVNTISTKQAVYAVINSISPVKINLPRGREGGKHKKTPGVERESVGVRLPVSMLAELKEIGGNRSELIETAITFWLTHKTE